MLYTSAKNLSGRELRPIDKVDRYVVTHLGQNGVELESTGRKGKHVERELVALSDVDVLRRECRMMEGIHSS